MSLDEQRWSRIASVSFETEETPGFVERLARENRWTLAYAERALAEYRRFACLAVTAPHEVTPSDEVDQVWHLHLAYSRHYWGPWTAALGRVLHHGPTAGGPAAAKRYRDAYAATLEAYFRAFGEEPPEDLWPDPGPRFAIPPRMRRVDLGRSVVVPVLPALRIAVYGLVAAVLLAAAGDRAGAAGRWMAEGAVGWVLREAPIVGIAIVLFGGVSAAGAVLGAVWRRLRRLAAGGRPRRRRNSNGTWSFSADMHGDGGGDSGCSGCGGD